MRTIPLSVLAAACGLLASCSTPVAMKSGDLAGILNSSPLGAKRVSMTTQVKSPGEKARTSPPVSGRFGDSLTIESTRDFVYPKSYDLPQVSGGAVTPATPTQLEKIQTGLTLNLKAEPKGSLIQLTGKVEMVNVDRLIPMGGALGQPITDDHGKLITENRTEMPAIRTYTTPVYLLVKPGEPVSFEIDHPKKGTQVTVTAKAMN